MSNIYSLSNYPRYCKYSLVPPLMIGNIDCPTELAHGCNCQQAEFRHSDLGGSTDGEHSLMLLTPPNMILHPSTYAEIPNQPCNPMLDIVNPVN